MALHKYLRAGLPVAALYAFAAGGAAAQENAPGLEEIVVTATKSAQQLTVQETPIAVTALGAAQLEQANVQGLADLTYMIPNVALNATSALSGVNNFSIRGMGVFGTIPSTTPTVGVFVDEVYVGANAGVALKTMFDLEGVEVLRGPQGLLFGRNVTAGAVLLRTTEPSDTVKIRAQASIESGPNTIFSATVSGPLTEDGELSGKIAAYYNHDQGYFTNLADGNNNFGQGNTGVVRGALAWRPNDNLKHVLRFEDGSTRADGPAAQDHARFSATSFDFAINNVGFNNIDWSNATLDSRYDVSWGDGQIVNIFGWRDINARGLTDVDATTIVNFHVGQFVDQHQISDELRYAGIFGPVALTVGAFYYEDRLRYIETRDLAAGAVFRIGGGVQHSDTWAVFSSADIEVSPEFTVNLGARYSEENKDAKVRVLATGSPCTVIPQRCTSFNFTGAESWSAFTPKIGVQWEPNEDTHLYAYWTKGFRSGGFNLRQTAITSPPGPYDQEVENTYEVGWKQDTLDDRLRFGLAIFRNVYKNLQRDLLFTDPLLGTIQTTINTADVNITGGEVEATLAVTDEFTLQANAGHLDSKFKRLRRALTSDGIITPAQLRLELPFQAKWSYGFSALYDAPVEIGQLSMRLSYQHVNRAFNDDLNLGLLNPINNVDADITVAFDGTGLSASVYGKNILDKTTFGLNTPLPFAPRQTYAPLNKGRVLGASLQYRY